MNRSQIVAMLTGLLLALAGGCTGENGIEPSPRPDGAAGEPAQQRADHVVFVVDRSGSMLRTFDQVRHDLLARIAKLKAGEQDCHVIFFGKGQPVEAPAKRLLPATKENRQALVRFAISIRAQGQTDPVPALRRAFAVLGQADGRGGRVLHLLTDGVFPDNQAVQRAIAEAGKDGGVIVETYLYGEAPPMAEKLLKKIAAENGGRYHRVLPEP